MTDRRFNALILAIVAGYAAVAVALMPSLFAGPPSTAVVHSSPAALTCPAALATRTAERDMWLGWANYWHTTSDSFARQDYACREKLASCEGERATLPLTVRGR